MWGALSFFRDENDVYILGFIDQWCQHLMPVFKNTPHIFMLSVAYREALEWGVFRGEGEEAELTPKVSLGAHGHYEPLPTVYGAPHLNRVFESGVDVLQTNIDNPAERGMAFFLFGAMQQFYFDGNKRTSRFMMNGILMQNGVDAISVPASQVFENKNPRRKRTGYSLCQNLK